MISAWFNCFQNNKQVLFFQCQFIDFYFFFPFQGLVLCKFKNLSNIIEGVSCTRINLPQLQINQECTASKALFSVSVSSHRNTHKAAIAVSCATSAFLSRTGGDHHIHLHCRQAVTGRGLLLFQGAVERRLSCPARVVTSAFNASWFITTQKQKGSALWKCKPPSSMQVEG